jgi:hypothetical protein
MKYSRTPHDFVIDGLEDLHTEHIAEKAIMRDTELEHDLGRADIIRDLAYAQAARKKQFAAIVRFVQKREASGPAADMMEQISRDNKLCKLLVAYEEKSEIIGMMEFVSDLKNQAAPSGRGGTARLTPASRQRPIRKM